MITRARTESALDDDAMAVEIVDKQAVLSMLQINKLFHDISEIPMTKRALHRV